METDPSCCLWPPHACQGTHQPTCMNLCTHTHHTHTCTQKEKVDSYTQAISDAPSSPILNDPEPQIFSPAFICKFSIRQNKLWLLNFKLALPISKPLLFRWHTFIPFCVHSRLLTPNFKTFDEMQGLMYQHQHTLNFFLHFWWPVFMKTFCLFMCTVKIHKTFVLFLYYQRFSFNIDCSNCLILK